MLSVKWKENDYCPLGSIIFFHLLLLYMQVFYQLCTSRNVPSCLFLYVKQLKFTPSRWRGTELRFGVWLNLSYSWICFDLTGDGSERFKAIQMLKGYVIFRDESVFYLVLKNCLINAMLSFCMCNCSNTPPLFMCLAEDKKKTTTVGLV